MELEHRIYQLFEDHLMATQQATDLVAPHICHAAEMIVATLVNDGCVWACGHRTGLLTAQRFCDIMTDRLERERPALPAYLLQQPEQDDHDSNPGKFGERVKAFGHPGDLFLVVSCDGESEAIAEAIKAARERGMTTIALTGGEGGAISKALDESDLEICIPIPSCARVAEIQWLVVHCIGDLVDNLLFGVEDN